MIFSIVVPFYNSYTYLSDCVESILSQDFRDFELILINDGSTDGSLQLCDQFVRRDSRVILIDKCNEGVSASRNLGVDQARGKYIVFVDADDVLESNTLSCIYGKIETAPDMVVYGFQSFGCGKADNDTALLRRLGDTVDSGVLLEKLISIGEVDRFRGLVWRCAFCREMLNNGNVRFHPNLKMAEDYLFVLQALTCSSQIAVVPLELYNYRINDASVTSHYAANVHADMLYVNKWILENICTKDSRYLIGYECCCAETYLVAIQNLCKTGTPYNYFERVKKAREKRKSNYYSQAIDIACKQHKILSMKRFVVFLQLWLHLEIVYIFLFSIKKKTLLKKSGRGKNDRIRTE